MAIRDPEHDVLAAADDPLIDDLRGARPTSDTIEMEDVRVRAARALFGAAEPVRVGRFVLQDRIASGGMGVVYGAYDPHLDRRVALKVLRPEHHATERARDRLIGEARALARLDHPNVVPIHDVTVVGDQVVIVMELIAGQTLATWACERPRSWREIVDVYLEAGRGLAAAHDIGLVHRDFKPTNAIVGNDGRVRVLDFGLARFSSDSQAEVPVVNSSTASVAGGAMDARPSTRAIIGTLGFMAPEQLAGEVATAQSDQFSFCVAMHCALHGVAPFAGTSAPELLRSIQAGQRNGSGDRRRVPHRVRAALDRGLAASPAARHPSMAQLLGQLHRARGWGRRTTLGAAFGIAALGITAAIAVAVAFGRGDPVAACDGGAAEVTAVWNAPRRDQIRRSFAAIDTAYAKAVVDEVTASLDRFRDGWSLGHRAACQDRRRGVQSDTLFDRRMTCLQQRLGALDAAVSVLGKINAGSVDHALEITAGMPRVADCADREHLLGGPEPPADATVRARLAVLRTRLAGAEALARAGRSAEALQAATELVAQSERLGYPPALVETLLVQGRILVERTAFVEAGPPLRRAEELALDHGLPAQAVIAAARWIYVAAMIGGDQALAGHASTFEHLSRNLRDDRFARPLLLNNIGVLHMTRNEPDQARAAFLAARDALARVSDPDLELTSIEQNLAMVTRDAAQREALARGAWQRFRDRLGPHHLRTLQTRYVYAHFVADPARSWPLVGDACDGLRAFHAELVAQRADCESYRAFLAAELGRDARRLYAEVIELARGSSDPDVTTRGGLAAGYARWHAGDSKSARAAFASVLATLAGQSDWWIRQRAAHAHLGLGLVEASVGHDREAVAAFEQAVATFAETIALGEDVETHQRLALSRWSLAVSLRRLDATSPRIAELERQAAEFYRSANPEVYRQRIRRD